MRYLILLAVLITSLNSFALEQEMPDLMFEQQLQLFGLEDDDPNATMSVVPIVDDNQTIIVEPDLSIFAEKGLTWDVLPFDPTRLYDLYHTDNDIFNDVMMQTTKHIGVPYVWGGDSWNIGIDCSHYTRHIYRDAGVDYGPYRVTKQLKDIDENRYFKAVSWEDARPGDLLVYGYTNLFTGKWHGHVVILIDKNYSSFFAKHGLVMGSHGKVGVQFITYFGFPNFYRFPFYRLRKILRVKDAWR